jgi:hypothetical protein
LSLSWARPIQSTPPNPISKRSVLMLSIHIHLSHPSGLFPSGFPNNNKLYAFLFSPFVPHVRPTSSFSTIIWVYTQQNRSSYSYSFGLLLYVPTSLSPKIIRTFMNAILLIPHFIMTPPIHLKTMQLRNCL